MTFSVAGARLSAEKAMTSLQAACSEVMQSSTILQMPLLFWQAPWFQDDSRKRESQAVLRRVAASHAVWWDFATADQPASSSPGMQGVTSGPDALFELQLGECFIKVRSGRRLLKCDQLCMCGLYIKLFAKHMTVTCCHRFCDSLGNCHICDMIVAVCMSVHA